MATTIPLPWVISILAILAVTVVVSSQRLPAGARAWFGIALTSTALAMFCAGLRLEYGHGILSVLQPHVAICMSVSFWLGFCSLMETEGRPTRAALRRHGLLVGLAQLCMLLPIPWSTDLVVTLVTSIYACLTTALLRQPQDSFVQVRPEDYRILRTALAACVAFLALVLVSDFAIILATVFAGNLGAMRLLAGAAGPLVAVTLVSLVIAIPLMRLTSRRGGASTEREPPMSLDEDRGMLARLEEVMLKTQIYRDPNLTLARLARRIGVPARAVSNAVNRCTGENLSRYINGFRITHASELLKVGELSVTEVMLEAGFQSKSTFNSEFRRVTGKTPTEFRKLAE